MAVALDFKDFKFQGFQSTALKYLKFEIKKRDPSVYDVLTASRFFFGKSHFGLNKLQPKYAYNVL
jgi:hypothetical protein